MSFLLQIIGRASKYSGLSLTDTQSFSSSLRDIFLGFSGFGKSFEIEMYFMNQI